ncbi:MAG: GNAT family N-acetyltransferase [Coriobacteriales bacterium]|jgi:predicted N-acetyltransferase YhbS|nr:GNAT family N-acetyltransferase [Coriobacteriales bacterium]
MRPPFTIRRPWASDLPYLKALFAEDAMPLPAKKQLMRGMVAADAAGEPVGFIRIVQIEEGQNPRGNGNYVYPVIVSKEWQGRGVGRALIQAAQSTYGELKLVACRASRGFYPRCGFEPLSWEEVASRIAYDCEQCPDLLSCEPQAFVLR